MCGVVDRFSIAACNGWTVRILPPACLGFVHGTNAGVRAVVLGCAGSCKTAGQPASSAHSHLRARLRADDWGCGGTRRPFTSLVPAWRRLDGSDSRLSTGWGRCRSFFSFILFRRLVWHIERRRKSLEECRRKRLDVHCHCHRRVGVVGHSPPHSYAGQWRPLRAWDIGLPT